MAARDGGGDRDVGALVPERDELCHDTEAQARQDADQSMSDVDQTQVDLDQAVSDADQVESDADQALADQDQHACDRDQVAAAWERSRNPLGAAAERAHDASRAEREAATRERGFHHRGAIEGNGATFGHGGPTRRRSADVRPEHHRSRPHRGGA
jgi:hypothetical protein